MANELIPSEGYITDLKFNGSLRYLNVPEIAILYTDMVQSTPLGDSISSLLSIIPMDHFSKKSGERNQSLYEPRHLIYYDVKDSDFNDIHIKMIRSDGKEFEIIPSIRHGNHKVGAIVTLRFRPKILFDGSIPSMNVESKKILTKTYGKRAFPFGPEGFS
jgi:hypothetical protein